jgi:hypothetical protein
MKWLIVPLILALSLIMTSSLSAQVPKEYQHEYDFDAVTYDGVTWQETKGDVIVDENTVTLFDGSKLQIDKIVELPDGDDNITFTNSKVKWTYMPSENVLVVLNEDSSIFALHIKQVEAPKDVL